MKKTLGLTGLTSNAMALIAPGAFLWLTFAIQAATGTTGPAMWAGIVAALLLCLATAVCYAEMAKLYPGTGSSYYFAEQSFLNHDKAWKYARISKFIVGWASHLYYWIYPGVMVGVMGIFTGFIVGTLYPSFMSASNPGIFFMMAGAIFYAFAIAYIAHRGVDSSTAVNLAINGIQVFALLVFAVLALQYRASHPAGSVAFQFDATSGEAYTYQFPPLRSSPTAPRSDTIVRDSSGVPVPMVPILAVVRSMKAAMRHCSSGAGSPNGKSRMNCSDTRCSPSGTIHCGRAKHPERLRNRRVENEPGVDVREWSQDV